MVVPVCLSTHLCSFDVQVCVTVEPSEANGIVFEGDRVGESANGYVCALHAEPVLTPPTACAYVCSCPVHTCVGGKACSNGSPTTILL